MCVTLSREIKGQTHGYFRTHVTAELCQVTVYGCNNAIPGLLLQGG